MATKVASIIAEIGIDSSKFTAGSRGVLSGIQSMISGLGSTAGQAGIAAAALGIAVSVMKDLEAAAVESAKADAKLEAVLHSTGGMAGMTSDALNGLAEQISKNAGLDDELVKSAEAVLLTFTRVGKDIFPEVMRSAADMAAVLGGDLQEKVISVGKAMNDFSGYTMLKRQGVSFTEEQIKQIANFKKTNDLAGYQALVMKELATEFGGAAKKMNDAGDGAENLNVAIGNLKEQFGGSFIGMFKGFNVTLTDMIDGFIEADNVFHNQSKLFNEAGVQVNILNAHYKDGVLLTKDHADALLNNAQVADNSTRSYEAMGRAVAGVGSAAILTDEQLDQISKDTTARNEGILGAAESLHKADLEYTTEGVTLAEKRRDLETERAGLIAKRYTEASKEVKALDEDLRNNAEEARKNAEAHKTAGIEIFASLLETKLKSDGEFSDADQTFLIDWKEKHGLMTEAAATEARQMVSDVAALYAGIPSEVHTTVYTHYVSLSGGDNQSPEGYGLPTHGANGLSNFIVPSGYNGDNYPVMAKSGESVSVTPAGQTSSDLSTIVRELRKLPTAMRDIMLQQVAQ